MVPPKANARKRKKPNPEPVLALVSNKRKRTTGANTEKPVKRTRPSPKPVPTPSPQRFQRKNPPTIRDHKSQIILWNPRSRNVIVQDHSMHCSRKSKQSLHRLKTLETNSKIPLLRKAFTSRTGLRWIISKLISLMITDHRSLWNTRSWNVIKQDHSMHYLRKSKQSLHRLKSLEKKL